MKNDNENKLNQDDEQGGQGGESGGTGQGGVGGEIRFRYRESLATPLRDDVLPASEIKRLLAVHEELHKEFVNKQKITRKERKALALKENRTRSRLGRAHGFGSGGFNPYKEHRITQKAQFSGMERQISVSPNDNLQNTNDEKRSEAENRLENRLENDYQLRATPKFNPTPRPR